MDQRYWFRRIILPCTLVSFCVALVFYSTNKREEKDVKRDWTDWMRGQIQDLVEQQRSAEISSLKFLYLTQTENCLPSHLTSVETIGNTSSCQCDVLVLSYKQPCHDASLPHVKYLFNSSTTWTTGRNVLLDAAMNRDKVYLYYIFMDDDINLKDTSLSGNPWRRYESFLKRVEPAVGAMSTDSGMCRPCLPRIHRWRRAKGCSITDTEETTSVVNFDAAFNAFHYQSMEYILPYSNKYDANGWFYSQFYVIIKSEIIFRGHVVLHTSIIAQNTKHRPYPHGTTVDAHATKTPTLNAIIEDVNKELPEPYRNSHLIQEWKKYGHEHEATSSTLCLPPPLPHLPIKPYAYFNKTLAG